MISPGALSIHSFLKLYLGLLLSQNEGFVLGCFSRQRLILDNSNPLGNELEMAVQKGHERNDFFHKQGQNLDKKGQKCPEVLKISVSSVLRFAIYSSLLDEAGT